MELNHDTGAAIDGWEEVAQSILTILTTRINTRVFRREFGSDVATLVDAPMNDANIMSLYVAVADALATWEPRFELSDVNVSGNANGVLVMELTGTYRPRAHLGDYSTVSDGSRSIRIARDRVQQWSFTK